MDNAYLWVSTYSNVCTNIYYTYTVHKVELKQWMIDLVRVFPVHLDLRNSFVTLVWNYQKSFYLQTLSYLFFLCVFLKYKSNALLLSYSIIIYYPYDIKLYTTLHTVHTCI